MTDRRWNRARVRRAALVTLVFCMAGCSAPDDDAAPSAAPSAPGSAIGASSRPASPSTSAVDGSARATSASGASGGSSSAASDASDAAGTGAGRGHGTAYDVAGVVDGDTIKVRIDGRKETIRIIGLDTPETKKPHVPVQCFGKEASSHMQSLVQSKQVQLEADASQGERDKYGRLLRHVFVGGASNVALAQIAGGYGREYTYDGPYRYRLEYLAAQNQAKNAHRGTWGPPCNGFHSGDPSSSASSSQSSSNPSTAPTTVPTAAAPTTSHPAGASTSTAEQPAAGCLIKGNINRRGEKIAHAPGSATYDRTRIITKAGERWFCTSAEAIAAGWRMAND